MWFKTVFSGKSKLPFFFSGVAQAPGNQPRAASVPEYISNSSVYSLNDAKNTSWAWPFKKHEKTTKLNESEFTTLFRVGSYKKRQIRPIGLKI